MYGHDRSTKHRDRAVSPVIGVVLMVAITIILAAVIGTFVFGLAPEDQRTATATIGIDGDAGPGNVTVLHRGGEPLDLGEVTLVVAGSTADSPANLDGRLHAGERRVIENLDASGESSVALRHDPSGEVIAETVATIE